MRPRTITVDISRGADYALNDYRMRTGDWYECRYGFLGLRRYYVMLSREFAFPDATEWRLVDEGWN